MGAGAMTMDRSVRYASGKPYRINEFTLIMFHGIVKPGEAVTEDHLEKLGKDCKTHEQQKEFYIYCALWLKLTYKRCSDIVQVTDSEMLRFIRNLFASASKGSAVLAGATPPRRYN